MNIELRRITKTINFGIIYGMGSMKLEKSASTYRIPNPVPGDKRVTRVIGLINKAQNPVFKASLRLQRRWTKSQRRMINVFKNHETNR